MERLRINQYIRGLAPSASIAMMDKARVLKEQGINIISLAGGEPDFDTPKAITEACFKAIRDGRTHYTAGRGILPLRERICQKLQDENNIRCTPQEILVTPGGKYAIFLAINTFINPGDEVLILDPSWVSYSSIVEMCGAVPVKVPLSFSDNYTIRRDALEQAVTPKTRFLILNSPNNPTGRVLTQQEAEDIRAFLLAHDLLLISDEVYEKIIYDGRPHISLGSYPDIADRVITVNSFSKSVAMTGWRIGYLYAAPQLVNAMYLYYQHTLTCISEFSQIAAIAALDCQAEMEQMRLRYAERRDLMCRGLNEIPGVICRPPEGAFYAWVRIEKNGMTDEQICSFLLDQARVVAVAGSGYGLGTESCVRMCFAAADEEIKESIRRIQNALL